MKPETLHRHFEEISEDICSGLSHALRDAGPITLPERTSEDFATYLSRVVVSQQLSVKAARAIWARIVSAADGNGVDLIEMFRSPRNPEIRDCGVSKFKAKTLAEIYQAKHSGSLDTQTLGDMSHEDRSKHLIQIWGIGQWTCDMASIFYFRELDVWPDGDSAVIRALELSVANDKMERLTTRELAARFAPYRSVLAMYLWKVLDARPT